MVSMRVKVRRRSNQTLIPGAIVGVDAHYTYVAISFLDWCRENGDAEADGRVLSAGVRDWAE